jgi:hypothetical protein
MLTNLKHALKGKKQQSLDALRAFNAVTTSAMSTIHGEPDHMDSPIRPSTPWVRSVISGVDMMRNAKVIKVDSYRYNSYLPV